MKNSINQTVRKLVENKPHIIISTDERYENLTLVFHFFSLMVLSDETNQAFFYITRVKYDYCCAFNFDANFAVICDVKMLFRFFYPSNMKLNYANRSDVINDRQPAGKKCPTSTRYTACKVFKE